MPLPAARGFTHLWALTPGALGQGQWGMCWPTVAVAGGAWPSRVLGGASAGGFWGARTPGFRVLCTAHVWVAGAWRGWWAVAPGSRGASALWLWGLCPGASSAVFWVDAWLSLGSRVLCSDKEHNPTIAIIELISSCKPTECSLCISVH